MISAHAPPNGATPTAIVDTQEPQPTEVDAPATWIDLLDPDEETLRRVWPRDLHPSALEKLLAPARNRDEPRPRLESQGSYVFGVFSAPIVMRDENEVCYQELYLVLTHSVLLTVRKTPLTASRSTSPRRKSSAGESGRQPVCMPSTSSMRWLSAT
jgi:Mg2+ and Co2+ transporter CorA